MEDELKLTDLIDADTLQRIQDAFSDMTGMAALTTDADGIPVTVGSNFSNFCMKHVRESEDGHIRCEQCDRFGAEDSWRRGSSSFYYCHAGLIDFAAPILADKQMVGSFIGGQVLTSMPDKGRIYELAWELGIDPQELWEAAQKIRILSEHAIEDAAQFLFTVANVLSDMAYGKYRLIQAKHEIECANNMKSDFLANMSHEIRTPMNAVIGMAEMALREELSPTVREYLRQIKSSSRALLTIINDILDFSKIESGKMDILPVEYEAMSIVNDVANIAVERLKDKEVELILDIAPDIPNILYGDNIRIKQVLLNLVNNAAKFTNSGQVLVRMSHVPLEEGRILLRFDVEDTGIGIKEKDLGSIFDSFQQADSKRNRNIEGTGLGLTISRQLTQLMEGKIHVKSEYGRGSTFSFELPQGVVDGKAACTILQADAVLAVGLLANRYVKKNLAADCARLQVEYHEISSVEEIQIPDGKKAFLFVEKELFTDKVRAYVRKNPQLAAVLLFPFRADLENYDLDNLLMVRKPLYSVNAVNIFNGEGLYSSYADEDTVDINFIAPSARVLVVDDNATNLVVTEGLLEPLHMRVDTVISGQEAIDQIAKEQYDLIFMDHMMPDMDGVEATHLIREKYPDYVKVPIIALTANAMSGTREMFLREGLNDFVSKPIEVKNLIKKVALWLPAEKMEKIDQFKDAHQVLEKIPELDIGDLDTKTAIKLIGSEKLYLTVLKNYYKMIPAKAQQIKELEQNEDWAKYTIEVHSLKSTSRQIGAMTLSDMAADLEKAGNEKNAEQIHACTDAMLEKYRAYMEVLEPICREEMDSRDLPEITGEILNGFFADMADAIEELDMDRMESVSAAMKNYSYAAGQQEFLKRLLEAVDNIDVDACEEIMKDWKAVL